MTKCNKFVGKILNLQEEGGGITSVSLHNALAITAKLGNPDQLDFYADKQQGDYFVTAHWEKFSFVFQFSGFAWGYGGTGPQGLREQLQRWNMNQLTPDLIPLDDGKTDCTYRPDGKSSCITFS